MRCMILVYDLFHDFMPTILISALLLYSIYTVSQNPPGLGVSGGIPEILEIHDYNNSGLG